MLANQYLIVDSGEAILVDPGGNFVFQRVLRAVSEIVDSSRVTAVFYSHQDPDIVGSLSLILEFFPNARICTSRLWSKCILHLGVVARMDIAEILDEGMEIPLGRIKLKAISAHFLRSPGNFTLYDPVVRVLFTSDIGQVSSRRGHGIFSLKTSKRTSTTWRTSTGDT